MVTFRFKRTEFFREFFVLRNRWICYPLKFEFSAIAQNWDLIANSVIFITVCSCNKNSEEQNSEFKIVFQSVFFSWYKIVLKLIKMFLGLVKINHNGARI